ncbi:MAG: OmpA family protein [Bryobacteraceae bacterium]
MKSILIFGCFSAALLAPGCATKKFVRQTTEPIQVKVNEVDERRGKEIEEVRTNVKEVDEKAEQGVTAASAANERAMTADGKAVNAMTKANEAGAEAAKANTASERNSRELDVVRQAFGNIDNFSLKGETAIQFGFDKAALTPEAKEKLDALAADLNKFKRFAVAVEGYTDRIGSAEYNAALSRRRANSVVHYLVAQHNIPIYRIHMIGLGMDRPADEGKDRDARARNRRVEVKVFTADPALAQTASQ